MTWQEIQKRYPAQWVSVVEVTEDHDGNIQTGVVVAAGPDVGSVTAQLKQQSLLADRLEFTGTVKNFLGFAKWDIGNAHIT